MFFPSRAPPPARGRCSSNHPAICKHHQFQKMSRLCLNTKMSLRLLLVVPFKRIKGIFEEGFCLILLLLLGSGHVITKTAAVNFNKLKRDLQFVKGIPFCHSFSHYSLTHFTITTCESEYLKTYVYMLAF